MIEFTNTEPSRPVTLPPIDEAGEAPKGLGWDGNKPLMRNRTATDAPSPIGNPGGNTFTDPPSALGPLTSDFSGPAGTQTPAPPSAGVPPAMLPEQNSGAPLDSSAHETPAASASLCDGSQTAESRSPTSDLRPPTSDLSARQRAAAHARWQLLKAALPLLESRLSQSQAARLVGIADAKLCRLLALAKTSGAERISSAEKCRRLLAGPLADLAPGVSTGAPSEFQTISELPAVRRRLLRLYVATFGASTEQALNDRRTGSQATALARLPDLCPEIPPLLAAKLRHGAKPKPFVQYLGRWTAELEAKWRGPRHYTLAGVSGRRTLTVEQADGTTEDLRPGTWVFDDMSSNLPFWFEVPAGVIPPEDSGKARGLARMIQRFGCGLGRQGLYAWDWASASWLGLELLGRVRDAYTKDIILRFVHKLILQYGKPDRIIFERNVWQANVISGWDVREDGAVIEVPDADERPAMEDETVNLLQDGLKAIGIELIYTHTPRGKPIEGAFNHHQRIVPTFLEEDEAVNIGRHAGEFEWAEKRRGQAAAGSAHPRDRGFIHIDRHADVSWNAMEWEGGRPKKSRGNQCPTEILLSSLASLPSHRKTLSEEEHARFLPEIRGPLKLRGGHVTVAVDTEPYQFIHPEHFAALGDGFRVSVAFDPAEPSKGMAIYNAEQSDRVNHLGYKLGQYICLASLHAAGPVISYRDRSEDEGVTLIKRYKNFHRTAYRAFDLTHFSRNSKTQKPGSVSEFMSSGSAPARIAEIRDGRGGVATATGLSQNSKTQKGDSVSEFVSSGSRLPTRALPRSRAAADDPELADILAEHGLT